MTLKSINTENMMGRGTRDSAQHLELNDINILFFAAGFFMRGGHQNIKYRLCPAGTDDATDIGEKGE